MARLTPWFRTRVALVESLIAFLPLQHRPFLLKTAMMNNEQMCQLDGAWKQPCLKSGPVTLPSHGARVSSPMQQEARGRDGNA